MSTPSTQEIELTCLMPCLNERRTIGACIELAQESIKSLGIYGEVLVADNGSTDGSIEIARALGARVIDVSVKGYGSALINGINSSNGKFIIMGDADGTYEWDKIDEIYSKLTQGYDLVMGNRFANKIVEGAMPFLSRFIGNPVLSFLGRVFFQIKVSDFHCGLRGFSKAKVSTLSLNCKGMEFASEIVIKSALSNFKITEVPTSLLPGPIDRKPHLRPFRDGWRHLRLMLSFAPLWSMIIPGLLFLIPGLLLSAIIYLNQGNFLGFNFREHTLIIAMGFILIGVSSILLGVLGLFSLSNYQRFKENFYLKKLRKAQVLESLLLFGLTVSTIGLFVILESVEVWKNYGFASLQSASLLSQLTPGVLSLLIGIQLMFTSFLFETIKSNLNKLD